MHVSDAEENITIWSPKRAPPTISTIFFTFIKVVVGEIFSGVIIWAIYLTNGIWAGTLPDPTNLAVVGLASVTCQVLIMYPVNSFAYGQDNFTG